jgi:general secretion pathway protein I
MKIKSRYGDKYGRRRRGGFTLLEMMIAVSIMAVGLTAVFQLHSQTLVLLHRTQFETVAPMLAQRKMAELEGRSATDLIDTSGEFEETYSGYQWQVTVSEVVTGRLEKVGQNFKRIDVMVQLGEGDLTYNLRSYRYFYE